MYVQGVPKIVVQHFEVESRSKKRSNAFSFKASFSKKKEELEKFRDMKLVFLLVFLSCCQTWPMPRHASCYCCYL